MKKILCGFTPCTTLTNAMVVVFSLCFTVCVSAQQNGDGCGELLRWGLYDESETVATSLEERRLFNFVCDEQSSSRSESEARSAEASYKLFSAAAKKGASSAEDYYERFCEQSEDEVFESSTMNQHVKRANEHVINAWRECKASQAAGLTLSPWVTSNQTRVVFDIQYDNERLREEAFLRGADAHHFQCRIGDDEISRSGMDEKEVQLTMTNTNVVCDRESQVGEIGGFPYIDYPPAIISLNLTTGAFNMEFVGRREGPVVVEFEELQASIIELQASIIKLNRGFEQRLSSTQQRLESFLAEERSPGQVIELSVLGSAGAWGVWTGAKYCPTNQYICGLEQRIEPHLRDGDDTAMNSVRFYCCSLLGQNGTTSNED